MTGRHGFSGPWWRTPRTPMRAIPGVAVGIPILGLGVLVAGLRQVWQAGSVTGVAIGLLVSILGALPVVTLALHLARPVETRGEKPRP